MSNVLWSTTEAEIQKLLKESEFDSTGDMYSYLLTWGNRVIRDINMEIDIRAHFTTADLTLTTSSVSVSLPSDFFKMSDRFTIARVGENEIKIIGLETLYSYDPDHDETSTASKPDYVSIEGMLLYQYPMVNATLVLDNYIKTPTDIADGTGNPDMPDDAVLQDLIIAGVCRKAYRWLQDFDALKLYTGEYNYYLELYRKHIDKTNSAVVQSAYYY